VNPNLQSPWLILECVLGAIAGLILAERMARAVRARLDVSASDSTQSFPMLEGHAGAGVRRDDPAARRALFERKAVVAFGVFAALLSGIARSRGPVVVIAGLLLFTVPKAQGVYSPSEVLGWTLGSLAAFWILDQVAAEILRRRGPNVVHPMEDLEEDELTESDLVRAVGDDRRAAKTLSGSFEATAPEPATHKGPLLDNVFVWLVAWVVVWFVEGLVAPLLQTLYYVRGVNLLGRARIDRVLEARWIRALQRAARRRPVQGAAMASAIDRTLEPRKSREMEAILLALAEIHHGVIDAAAIARVTGLSLVEAAQAALVLVDLHGGRVVEDEGRAPRFQIPLDSPRKETVLGDIVVSSARAGAPVWLDDERLPQETASPVRAVVVRTEGLRAEAVTNLLKSAGGLLWGFLWIAIAPYTAQTIISRAPGATAVIPLAELLHALPWGLTTLLVAVSVGVLASFSQLVLWVAWLDIRRAQLREARRAAYRECFDAAEQGAARASHEIVATVLRHLGGARTLLADGEVATIVDAVLIDLGADRTPEGRATFAALAREPGAAG